MSNNTQHDPLCPYGATSVGDTILPDDCHYCDLIAKVREEERAACIRAIRSRRDDLVRQIKPMPVGPVGSKGLASALYEDAIATLRLPEVNS